MAVSISSNFESLKMEAKQYHMNRDIAKSNIALLKSMKLGQKFLTDKETGKLTAETNIGIKTTFSRTFHKVFKPSSIVATLQFIQDKAKDLQEDFDVVLRNSDGLNQLIATYKANFVFRSMARDLSAIKDHYIHFATPKAEPPPVVLILHDTSRLPEFKAEKPEKKYKVLSEDDEEKKVKTNRGVFSKILSDFKHRSVTDLKSLLKKSDERQLKPAPLTRSISCSHVDILKSENFAALIDKAKNIQPVKIGELSDDDAEWEDKVEKENPQPLDHELLHRLERLNRRCLQQHDSKVHFSSK